MESIEKVLKKISDAVELFGEWVQLPRHEKLQPRLMYHFTESSRWSETYLANIESAGCYFFVDSSFQVRYVGSVSGNSDFGKRFHPDYICRNPIDPEKIDRRGHCEKAEFIFVIEVSDDHAFIAPALEQFLITYFNPSENKKDFVNALRKRLVEYGKVDELD